MAWLSTVNIRTEGERSGFAVWSLSLRNPRGQERPRWAWNRVTLLTGRFLAIASLRGRPAGGAASPPWAAGAVTCPPLLTVSGSPCCLGALLCFSRGIERSKLSHADRWVSPHQSAGVRGPVQPARWAVAQAMPSFRALGPPGAGAPRP